MPPLQVLRRGAAMPAASGASSSGTSAPTSARRRATPPPAATAASTWRRGPAPPRPAGTPRAPALAPAAAAAARRRIRGGRACPRPAQLLSTRCQSTRGRSCRTGAPTAWACSSGATATGKGGCGRRACSLPRCTLAHHASALSPVLVACRCLQPPAGGMLPGCLQRRWTCVRWSRCARRRRGRPGGAGHGDLTRQASGPSAPAPRAHRRCLAPTPQPPTRPSLRSWIPDELSPSAYPRLGELRPVPVDDFDQRHDRWTITAPLSEGCGGPLLGEEVIL